MADGAVSSARDPQHDTRWKWLLLGICALAAVLVIATTIDEYGIGGRPWFGVIEATVAMTDRSYVEAITGIDAGTAPANAGLRDGDRIDLREQTFDARVRIPTELQAGTPLTIRVHRGARGFSSKLVGRTLLVASTATNADSILALLSAAWFLACATLIAARRWWRHEARVLALVMLCQVGYLLNPTYLVVPSAKVQLLLFGVAVCLFFLEITLLVALSSRYAGRTVWRRSLEWCAYAVNTVTFLIWIAAILGLATLWFDPLPYLSMIGYVTGGNVVLYILTITLPPLAVAFCALAAVITSPSAERPRAAWLLLPLPLAIGAYYAIYNLSYLAPTYSSFNVLNLIGAACWFAGGFAVTYALLKRRVLDVGFVLSRTVVVSIVGLIVVVAFVLLEWILGSVLTGVSHATGLIANAALALLIGVSLSYIHKRVDQSVDLVLFRKRHEDERALLAFSKEAAYVTDWDALLDATIEKVRRHTDTRSAAVLICDNGFLAPVRGFGDGPITSVSENDDAVLSLKTWHKAIDPHHYDTALHAALALPMLSRGKLYGVLILGERAGGEAYAPDEVEALSQLANGVGSALEALSLTTDGSATAMADYIAGIHHAIESLAETLEAKMQSEIRALRTSSLT